jgi:hypothetical protein
MSLSLIKLCIIRGRIQARDDFLIKELLVTKFFVTLAAAAVLVTAIAPVSVHAQTVLAKKGWIVDGALQ